MASQEKLDSLANLLKEVLSEGQEIDAAEFPYIVIKGDVDGKGILWKGSGNNKQLLFVSKPDRFFISENIDLAKGKGISVNSIKLLDEKELGPTVTKSNLREIGRLNGLIVDGSVSLSQYVYFDSNTNRLGLGTEEPAAAFSVAEDGVEVVIGTQNSTKGFIGTYASNSLDIITDNTSRINISAGGNITLGNTNFGPIQVSVIGAMGINVKTIDPRASLHVSGAIKFNDKLHLSGAQAPQEGAFKEGDITWNCDPQPGKLIGWVCTRAGSPGLWSGFGRIE